MLSVFSFSKIFNLGDDENIQWHPNCSSIRKHRFQCSQNESTCLLVWVVGNAFDNCITNRRDEYVAELNLDLSSVICQQQKPDGCKLLRKYIQQSSTSFVDHSSTSNTAEVSLGVMTSFWRYCNSIWDLYYGADEMAKSCKYWKCNQDYYQCQTGQCIPLNWLCNNVWDCSDGSDEEGFQLIANLSDHNSKFILNLTAMKEKCAKANAISSFSKECDMTREYPCLLANVTNALDFTINRPCINLTQIGDGYVDCYGGLDERNLLSCSSHRAQGFSFQCVNDKSSQCILNGFLCTTRCSSTDEDALLCFHLLNNSYSCQQSDDPDHATVKDVRCFNGTCIPNAKCNGKIECEEFAEDEYYCNTGPQKSTPFVIYRYDAHRTEFKYEILLPLYPHNDTEQSINSMYTSEQQDGEIASEIISNHLFLQSLKYFAKKIAAYLSYINIDHRRRNQASL